MAASVGVIVTRVIVDTDDPSDRRDYVPYVQPAPNVYAAICDMFDFGIRREGYGGHGSPRLEFDPTMCAKRHQSHT